MSNVRKNALEWVVFAISTVLVLCLLGFLGYASWTHTDSPPRIELTLKEPTKIGKSWQVGIEAENHGGHAAESVEIEVEWPEQKQQARFILPELPRQGRRVGFAVFEVRGTKQLETSALKARVVGYEEG